MALMFASALLCVSVAAGFTSNMHIPEKKAAAIVTLKVIFAGWGGGVDIPEFLFNIFLLPTWYHISESSYNT